MAKFIAAVSLSLVCSATHAADTAVRPYFRLNANVGYVKYEGVGGISVGGSGLIGAKFDDVAIGAQVFGAYIPSPSLPSSIKGTSLSMGYVGVGPNLTLYPASFIYFSATPAWIDLLVSATTKITGFPAFSGSGSASGFGGRIALGLLDAAQNVGVEVSFTPASISGTFFYDVAGGVVVAF